AGVEDRAGELVSGYLDVVVVRQVENVDRIVRLPAVVVGYTAVPSRSLADRVGRVAAQLQNAVAVDLAVHRTLRERFTEPRADRAWSVRIDVDRDLRARAGRDGTEHGCDQRRERDPPPTHRSRTSTTRQTHDWRERPEIQLGRRAQHRRTSQAIVSCPVPGLRCW